MDMRSRGLCSQWIFIAVLTITALPGAACAWGLHGDITQAAVNVLGPQDAIVRQLGDEMANLCQYSWRPDMRRSLLRDKTIWYYADDFLLFPASPTHTGHVCPQVELTYEPFFRRALQALRTETAPNAARWIGSLLHFVEDTGAPPHAAPIAGDLGTKLETWLNAKDIHIAGYRPQSLGRTDDEALKGLFRRMDGLIEYSIERAERAKAFALQGDRAATEAIVIESALESSRVVADVLLTLGQIADQTPTGNDASLCGAIASGPSPGIELVPAKVMLLGTNYSTLADAETRYHFRHLPPGNYTLAVLRPGSAVATDAVTLAPRRETVKDLTLSPDSTPWNMVRNAAMSLCWVTPDRPDDWQPVKLRPSGMRWEGEPLPLKAGVKYRLQVVWQEGATGKVSLRTQSPPKLKKPPVELKPLTPGQTQCELTATADTVLAQPLIYCPGPPSKTCAHIAFGGADAIAP